MYFEGVCGNSAGGVDIMSFITNHEITITVFWRLALLMRFCPAKCIQISEVIDLRRERNECASMGSLPLHNRLASRLLYQHVTH